MTYQAALNASESWREKRPDHKGGVVLVWQGRAYGWKDRLRDAGHERPGAHAVDADGHVFVAEGGNDCDGARCWVVVSPRAITEQGEQS